MTVHKTAELVIGFRRSKPSQDPLIIKGQVSIIIKGQEVSIIIKGQEVSIVSMYKYLGTVIDDRLE